MSTDRSYLEALIAEQNWWARWLPTVTATRLEIADSQRALDAGTKRGDDINYCAFGEKRVNMSPETDTDAKA